MKYKVSAILESGKKYESELPIVSLDYARAEADILSPRAKVVTILRDDEGEYFQGNAGKYFLYQIFK